MKHKRFAILLAAVLLSVTMLVSCGGGGGGNDAPKDDPKEEEQEQQVEENAEPIDTDRVVEIVFDDMDASISYASEIKISLIDDDGNYTVTFKFNGEDCKYVVNAYTGAIVSKEVPDGIVEATKNELDPFSKACDECLKYVGGGKSITGEENLHVAQDGTDYIVEFDWDGKHYEFVYNETDGPVQRQP